MNPAENPHAPKKKKGTLKAALLGVAGLSALGAPSSEAQETFVVTGTRPEARAEKERISGATVKEASIYEYDEYERDYNKPGSNNRYLGKKRYFHFKLVLDDEGVIDMASIRLSEGEAAPFSSGQRVTVRYEKLRAGIEKDRVMWGGALIPNEITTEDGRVIGPERLELG